MTVVEETPALEKAQAAWCGTPAIVTAQEERRRQTAPPVGIQTGERKQLNVWICPTPGCLDFTFAPLGENGQPIDLAHEGTGPKTEDRHQVSKADSRVGVAGKRHSRAECPTCRASGVFVDRVLRKALVQV